MAVHVGEIRTELSGTRAHATDGQAVADQEASRYPGDREDAWRGIQAHLHRLTRRVCAEDFHD